MTALPVRAGWRLLLFLLLCVGQATRAGAGDVFLTVTADSTAPIAPGFPERLAAAGRFKPWLTWARMGADSLVFAPRMLPRESTTAQATRTSTGASVLVNGPAEGEGFRVKTGALLEAGLYRVEAAVIQTGQTAGDQDTLTAFPARAWRMESVLLARAAVSTKSVPLKSGQTLIVRWTETVSEARFRLQTARRTAAARGGPTTYTGITIAKALGQAARLLGEVQTLAARGNRPEIARRTHLALLSVAQAQAMARNRPGAMPGDEDDTAFIQLTLALSEISAAACNLVSSETAILGADGLPAGTRVSLTNAGSRTIPLVTLALPASADAAVAAREDRRQVFRNVRPGAKITAQFPATATAEKGSVGASAVVQFIVGVGAAVVTAAPPP